MAKNTNEIYGMKVRSGEMENTKLGWYAHIDTIVKIVGISLIASAILYFSKDSCRSNPVTTEDKKEEVKSKTKEEVIVNKNEAELCEVLKKLISEEYTGSSIKTCDNGNKEVEIDGKTITFEDGKCTVTTSKKILNCEQ